MVVFKQFSSDLFMRCPARAWQEMAQMKTKRDREQMGLELG